MLHFRLLSFGTDRDDFRNLSGATPSHSLTIITGVGNHSKNRVGVIGPAVQNALEGEGWRTSKRPGAIVVSGAKNTSIKT